MDPATLILDAEKKFHKKEFLKTDPLCFVHHFSRFDDQEAMALFAAQMAYGNVKQIQKSLQTFLLQVGCSNYPSGGLAKWVWSLQEPKGQVVALRQLNQFKHRFNSGEDWVLLGWLLSESWKRYGSLGKHLASHLKQDDPNFGKALSLLIDDWKLWIDSSWGKKPKQSFAYLISSPKNKSCCKRWCMLFRWMGRGGTTDEVDLGLWLPKKLGGHGLVPGQLVMPLDTHTGRISLALGLTCRKTLDWKAAEEVTEALRALDKSDPVRFDFAICRLGILKLWNNKKLAK